MTILVLTPFEEFIATYWWQLGTLLVIVIGGFWKLSAITKSVEDHHSPNNPTPHPNLPCAAHKEMLTAMSETLKRIDERVYAIVKHNGYDKEHKA